MLICDDEGVLCGVVMVFYDVIEVCVLSCEILY